jgi:hydrogenase expression/formation protein HypD
LFSFRDKETAKKIVEKLRMMKLDIRIMHVCGTQQDTIVRHGLDALLEGCGVEMRQGPGCPICITPPEEFEEAVVLARCGVTITAYGDALKVPGITGSLADAHTEGCDVRIVYSVEDAIKIAAKLDNNVVFMAVGFETTAPSTAAILLSGLPENFLILNCHRYVPPALYTLLDMGEMRLDGLIEPGHVSTVIGVKPYEDISKRYGIPQVVAGFEPLDILMAVYMLARQIRNGEARVENEYIRSVRYEGNMKALETMSKVFEPVDSSWRGFGVIPKSGMGLKRAFKNHDARRIYEAELREVAELEAEPAGCRCGEILRGIIYPEECLLFGRACTPEHPIGPCMVSMEGSCNIGFKYEKRGR